MLTVAEINRKEKIIKIQGMLGQGYSAGYIIKALGVSYEAIRKYKDCDPDLLCRGQRWSEGTYGPIDRYKDFILECMNNKMPVSAILREINKTSPDIKPTTFNSYCKNIKAKYGISYKTNIAGKELIPAPSSTRYIKRTKILMHLWTGKTLATEDYAIVCEKYEVVRYLENFIFDFKTIFDEKEIVNLTGFLEIYEDSKYSKVKSFIKGLRNDLDAVENAVALPHSNGFVEGNNNRVKMIKRMMYGRAKLPLLTAKVLFGQ
jgi:hypothetical protein